MGPWWMYVLMFLFGYFTHKTFYFFRAMKISIGLIRVSQLVSLAVLAKSLENVHYTQTARLRQMREQNKSEKEIRDVRRAFNNEVRAYKERVVREIIDLHPSFYDSLVNFDDWKSAMELLEKNRHFVLQLLNQDKNDKKTS